MARSHVSSFGKKSWTYYKAGTVQHSDCDARFLLMKLPDNSRKKKFSYKNCINHFNIFHLPNGNFYTCQNYLW